MKLLVNPLAWYLVVQSVGLVILWRRTKGSRALIVTLIVLTAATAAFATQAAGILLERALTIDGSSMGQPPEHVFVLGGGYLPGRTNEEDLLGSETERRVLHGVSVWRSNPTARLIMSGAAPDFGGARRPERMVELMADAAIRRGVPPTQITLEPRSINTREHPVEALKLPGISALSPITIVTASWHTRRARREFCRYFTTVNASAPSNSISPISLADLAPVAGSLGGNTSLVREVFGMAWYALRGLTGPASKC